MNKQEISLVNGVSTFPQKEEPFFVIEPSKKFWNLDWKEMWLFRELFYFLVWREIKVRYKQTLLGASWAIIQPLFNMIIFTLFFGRLAGIPSDNIPYPLFSYSALVVWTFFAQSVLYSSQSLIANTNLVTKIYFPRLAMPFAPVASCLVDFVIACSMFLILMPYYRYMPSANIIWIPIMLLVAFIAASGVGIGLAALNVKFRDFRYVVNFMIQFWMFSSPVVYPASMLPEKWRLLYGLNPMTGAIEGFRWALLGTSINPWPIVGISLLSSLVILYLALFYFKRTERFFADLI